MKPQREYQVRRVAVFTGYGHPEPGPAWSRVAHRPAVSDNQDHGMARGLREVAGHNAVIQLEPVARPAELQRAA